MHKTFGIARILSLLGLIFKLFITLLLQDRKETALHYHFFLDIQWAVLTQATVEQCNTKGIL